MASVLLVTGVVPIEEVAQRITDDLFLSLDGKPAERLVQKVPGIPMQCPKTWRPSAVKALIERHLSGA